MTGDSRRARNVLERVAARVYIKQHKIREANCELQGAVALAPEYTVARREPHCLLGMLN